LARSVSGVSGDGAGGVGQRTARAALAQRSPSGSAAHGCPVVEASAWAAAAIGQSALVLGSQCSESDFSAIDLSYIQTGENA
jgi:hypothetical protein